MKQDEKENIHPNFSNQVGSGDSLNEQGPSNDTKDAQDCITVEEAIEGNLNTRYDHLIFLKTREDEIKSILQKELVKRKRMEIYLTLQVRFTKSTEDRVEVAEPHFHRTQSQSHRTTQDRH